MRQEWQKYVESKWKFLLNQIKSNFDKIISKHLNNGSNVWITGSNHLYKPWISECHQTNISDSRKGSVSRLARIKGNQTRVLSPFLDRRPVDLPGPITGLGSSNREADFLFLSPYFFPDWSPAVLTLFTSHRNLSPAPPSVALSLSLPSPIFPSLLTTLPPLSTAALSLPPLILSDLSLPLSSHPIFFQISLSLESSLIGLNTAHCLFHAHLTFKVKAWPFNEREGHFNLDWT